jgi:carboxyl-terminal processing protease
VIANRQFLVAALVAAAFVMGAVLGARTDRVGDAVDNLFGDETTASSEALNVISDRYFHDVQTDELQNSSVRGIVNELRRKYKDRFSHYFGPNAYKRFQEVLERRFSGVGLSVTEIPRGLRVANAFPESPARKAGIRVGDIITAVDGRSIAGDSAELATARIKGKKGTDVTLTVMPQGGTKERDFNLTREELQVPEVIGRLRQAGGVPVAYVQLLGFSRGAHAELRDEIEKLDDQGAKALVLDLRGNGGGLLTEGILTSSLFVEDGAIVSTQRRSGGDETFDAVGDALPGRPIVVLINGDTASASEILTAALHDSGLATVVGETTFGKGTFQEVIPLDNGGALDLTVGEYLTRGGDSVNGVGIPPDVKARDIPKTRRDEALARALQELAPELSGASGSSSG